MKLSSLSVGLSLLIFFYLLGPYIFITLNQYFGLPTFSLPRLDWLGLLLIFGGLSFITYLFFIFRRVGHGSPVPTEGTQKLIIQGPYKFTRNPMYLAHLCIWFGIFIVFGDVLLILYLLLGWLGLHLFLLKWEEPHLTKKFGQAYTNYTRRVPRWLPKFKSEEI